jgi:hypothetical protein
LPGYCPRVFPSGTPKSRRWPLSADAAVLRAKGKASGGKAESSVSEPRLDWACRLGKRAEKKARFTASRPGRGYATYQRFRPEVSLVSYSPADKSVTGGSGIGRGKSGKYWSACPPNLWNAAFTPFSS